MKAVMLSIQPKWCEKIASGEKTVEVRKTRPKIETPFKCFIYETNWSDNTYWKNRHKGKLGKVIGEFVCDRIEDMRDIERDPTCLSIEEWLKYTDGHKGIVYGWHISDLVIYDKPKELSEFHILDNEAVQKCEHREQAYYGFTDTGYIKNGMYCREKDDWCIKCKTKAITRPPQSWCYVEVQR